MDEIKLQDFLETDSVVKTKLIKSTEWIANIISFINYDTNELEIPFNDRYLAGFAMVGEKIQVTQTIEGFEYIIDAMIIQISIEPTKTMKLRVEKISKMENRRKDERYSVSYAVTVQSYTEFEGVFGVVTNISVSGVAFVCRKNFMHGEMVRLSIMLPASVFTIDAEIMRVAETQNGIEYGVRFIRNDEEAMKDIDALIENIKEREDRLSRIVGFNL